MGVITKVRGKNVRVKEVRHQMSNTNHQKSLSKYSRECPKCGSAVIGCILTDVPKDDLVWSDMGVICINCDWVLQLRHTNL